MSLILDALRRADSERERGSVPGLHSQPVPPLSMEQAPRRRSGHWPWVVVSVAVGLVLASAWFFLHRETANGAGGFAAKAPLTAAAPVAAAERTPPSVPVDTQVSRPSETPQVAEPAPWPTAERKAPQTNVAAALPSAQASVAAEPHPAPSVEAPVYTREQLPENVRAQLPQLAVGGSIYSSDAASRSVIINGRIYRENDRLTSDLLLEQIKLKAAVLKFKGYRFEIEF